MCQAIATRVAQQMPEGIHMYASTIPNILMNISLFRSAVTLYDIIYCS